MTRARLAALCALWGVSGCEDIPYQRLAPRVLAVDLIDNQAPPARGRLYALQAPDPTLAQDLGATADLGPDLSIRVYLAAPLSTGALQLAPQSGITVTGEDGQQVSARGFRQEIDVDVTRDPAAPMGTVQILTLTPDLRSGRTYQLNLSRGQLLSAAGDRFEVPPTLRFTTARRFVVLRATPPQGSLAELTEVRLTLSSAAFNRPSSRYGVTLRSGDQTVETLMSLSMDRRTLIIEPLCPLGKGAHTLAMERAGVEEDSTLVPLAEPFSQSYTVTEDPGPCRDRADLSPPPDMGADMR